jgi:hypothetical protein
MVICKYVYIFEPHLKWFLCIAFGILFDGESHTKEVTYCAELISWLLLEMFQGVSR